METQTLSSVLDYLTDFVAFSLMYSFYCMTTQN